MAECACGCREQTAGGTFRPGHDSYLRADAEHRAGGVIRLAKLVEAAEAFKAGDVSLADFGERVRVLMPASRAPAT
jgi:hypothetical protein